MLKLSSASLWSLTSCVLGVTDKKNKSFSDNESSYGSESESETSADDIVFETLKGKKPVKRMKKDSQPEVRYAEKIEYSIISMDDFLYKQNEFRLWLREKRKPELCSRLSASKQNKYFKEFVKVWNKRKLPPKYYKQSLLTRRDTLSAPVTHNQRFSFAEHTDNSPLPGFQPSPQVAFSADSPQRKTPFSTFGKQVTQRTAIQTLQSLTSPAKKISSLFGDQKKLLMVPAQVVSKHEPEKTRIREPKKRKTNRNEMLRKCSVCSHHPLTRQCAKKCLLAATEED